jgi:hypothetical protein
MYVLRSNQLENMQINLIYVSRSNHLENMQTNFIYVSRSNYLENVQINFIYVSRSNRLENMQINFHMYIMCRTSSVIPCGCSTARPVLLYDLGLRWFVLVNVNDIWM